ncbi:hypothetical protein [Neopusillimonas aromaticivorans]|uniref:hypothetical protein n=1 Tax=Neopusillimonas aromaticivorans TaxID=2979868 RepID=UPI00259573B3|nr:hypothetical protein [Neopusillimonas aromaticivorans]WJJ94120.1 hypothetical protein N7E01_02945 [Neopusillimonas aromaticivorans]
MMFWGCSKPRGRWDGVWVLGLTDDVLPAPMRPNPLLPAAVLRHAGAPRATPERELQWAGMLFDDLCRLAPQVWFSHALHAGESELRPSPFITAIAQVDLEDGVQALRDRVSLEILRDERGPPLAADEKVSGGIGLLDTQARNPLWAFVKYRLGASQLPDYAGPASQNARGCSCTVRSSWFGSSCAIITPLRPRLSMVQSMHG